jgi:hypothetical protein
MTDPQPPTPTEIRRIRRQLRAGEITPDEAREQGFPPADPIKEKR